MVHLNEYGYYEVNNKPTQDELNTYYSEKYYQDDNTSSYKQSYSSKELAYFNNKIAQKHQYLLNNSFVKEGASYKLLDVGCGEGFTLSYFKNLGWEVTGLDFSSFGCKTLNPHCLDDLIIGDIYQNLEGLTQGEQKYDVIWLDNVLEHVLSPLDLLQKLHKISSSTGALIIEVPNDFSVVQQHLYNRGTLKEQNWVVTPDHLSYFNKKGLSKLCQTANWTESDIISDFPIDWFLFNPHSNYYVDRTKGKEAHQARIEIENLLHNISTNKAIELYKTLADMGLGRQLIGFFMKNS